MVQSGFSVETSAPPIAPQYLPVPPSISQCPPVSPSAPQCLSSELMVHGAALRAPSPKVSGSIPGGSDLNSPCSPCGCSLLYLLPVWRFSVLPVWRFSVLPVWRFSALCAPRVEVCVSFPRPPGSDLSQLIFPVLQVITFVAIHSLTFPFIVFMI